MTRGKFVVITDDKVLSTFEFNGDMYYTDYGHGPEVIERLGRVNNTDDLNKEVREFNENNHKYEMDDGDTFLECQNPIDFSDDYFGYWFSDYLYIKNLASTEKVIKDRDGNEHTVLPNQIVVFDFGHLYGIVADDGKTLNLTEDNED